MIEMTLLLFGFVTNTIFIEHRSRQIISIIVKKKREYNFNGLKETPTSLQKKKKKFVLCLCYDLFLQGGI